MFFAPPSKLVAHICREFCLWEKIYHYFSIILRSVFCYSYMYENFTLFFFDIWWDMNFPLVKILVCAHIWDYFLFDLIFWSFGKAIIFKWSKSSYVHARGDDFLFNLIFWTFGEVWISIGQNPRMCMRVEVTFYLTLFFGHLARHEFPLVKILVCACVWRWLFIWPYFLDIWWGKNFQMVKIIICVCVLEWLFMG